MTQSPKQKADQMFGDKFNIIRPLIQNYNWDFIKKTILELCIDEVSSILRILEDEDLQTHKFYKDVLSILRDY